MILGTSIKAPGFCAHRVIDSFGLNGTTPSDKEALSFTRQRLLGVGGAFLIFNDYTDAPVHKHCTDLLPDEFDAENAHGDGVKCFVHRRKPYEDISTGKMIKEVRIQMVRKTSKAYLLEVIKSFTSNDKFKW